MNGEEKAVVPYIVYESALARQERTIKRLWMLCLVIFAAFVGSNLYWIWYESQFEDVVTTTTQEVEQDSEEGGSNMFIGGDWYYGETEGQDDDHNEEPDT